MPKSDEEVLKPVEPKQGFRFSNDVFLLESFLQQRKIEYKPEDLEHTPFGKAHRVTANVFDCKKCGAKHGMGIENMETGEFEPIDTCKECLFVNTKYLGRTEPVHLTCEWGGSMRAMIDGENKNIADHLNETEKKLLEGL